MVSDRVQNLGAYFVGLNYDYICGHHKLIHHLSKTY